MDKSDQHRFAFCTSPWLRASALALIYLALSTLVIDYFSKERAITYRQEINGVQQTVNEE